MSPLRTTAAVLLAASSAGAAQAQAVHRLMPTPTTVAWGYYDAAAAPVLRIRSGDVLVVGTLITSSPERLQAAGVPPAQVEPALREIYRTVTNKGPGGHILTGPVYVEGADSGDVLEVHIQRIDLAIPYAYNAFGPRGGFLREDFPYTRMRIIPLDRGRMVARFAPGIEVPLHPFFGSIGVAPPRSRGRVNSAPPDIHAGNLDNKELVAGTTLYIPVHTAGALLEIGDGHAGQGNGEVDITALETSLVGTFRVSVRKDMHLSWPRAETPTHWIAMGMDTSLVQATKIAVRQAVDFLVTTQGLTRDDAYMLTSVACDVDVTELVDGNVGVHVMIPKRILRRPVGTAAAAARRP
jgi:acetamidase/formamidase